MYSDGVANGIETRKNGAYFAGVVLYCLLGVFVLVKLCRRFDKKEAK